MSAAGGSGSLSASVVVRTKNSEATLEAALSSLKRQSVDAELIVVDSGSTDSTFQISAKLADEILKISPDEFSYGGALNLGAESASGDVVFALSSHCSASSVTWIEDSLKHYSDEKVAATNGSAQAPSGGHLARPLTIGGELLDVSPYWGFANHASSWRRSVWQQEPFDEGLTACEDKEWSYRIVKRGYRIVFDPALVVDDSHRRSQGKRALLRRIVKESEAIVTITGMSPVSFAESIKTWWSDFGYDSRYPNFVRRLGVSRSIEIFGRYAGERRGRSGGSAWSR